MKHSFTVGFVRKYRITQLLLPLMAALLCSLQSWAQSFTTSITQSTIGKNQYAEVSYEISNASDIQDFQTPQYRDWIVVSGPNSSSSMTSINGQVNQKTTLSFFLQPKHTGHLLVEGARVTLNGKVVTSPSRTVEVLDKNVNNPHQNNAPQVDPFGNMLSDPFFSQQPPAQQAPRPNEFADAIVLRPGENTPEKIQKNLFIKVVPSKTTCYEGEPIMVTYKVYTRLDLENASVTRRPSFSGFGAYDMDEPNQPFELDELNGKHYKSWAIRKVQLYPLQSGQLTLDPVEVDCNISFVKGETVANGTYDPYSQNSFTKVQYTLKSPAITITALPLPTTGKPANFSGAVGNFTIKADVSDTHPGKDDATHLTIEIDGSGNFSMVHAPAIPWAAGTESYDAKETENLDKTIVPISGGKSFDYVFLPHRAGTYTVPSVSFSYFDVASKSYKTVSTDPVTLQVSNESKHSNNVQAVEENWPATFSHIAAIALPVLAIILLLVLVISFLGKRKKKQVADDQAKQVRNAWEKLLQEAEAKKATTAMPTQSVANEAAIETESKPHQHDAYMPAAVQALDQEHAKPVVARETEAIQASTLQAETLIWQDDHRLFYKALKADIIQHLADKAGTGTADKTALTALLKQKGTDGEVLQQVSALIDECDAALYSPISTANDRQNMLEEAKFLLSKL